MKIAHPWLLAAAAVGLAAAALLVIGHGANEVWAAIVPLGWGFLIVVLYRGVSLVTASAAWRTLYPKELRHPLLRMSLWRWICEAVNSLLPVAQVGGDLVRARLAALPSRKAQSGAAVVVDITLNLVIQLLFSLLALSLLMSRGEGGFGGPLAGAL
ncbi:MAG: TIGR00374 family protein, partial [Rhodospirillales bacterium]